jgi:uncharacterized protein (TIGR03435 family)
MQCNEIRNHFADYITEDLEEPIQREFFRHLRECSDCQAEFQALTDLWMKLGSVPAGEPASPDLDVRLRAALDEYRLISLLGKGRVRGGLVKILADLQQSVRRLIEPPLAPPLPRRGIRLPWSGFAARWKAAAALLVLVVLVFVAGSRVWMRQSRVAEAVDGSLYRVAGGTRHALQAGEPLTFGETLHSNGAGAIFALTDGSRVEMRAQSEASLERADDGVRIRLSEGGVIVNAAKQQNGRHLYVQTKDVTVSVVGTVFLVNAEEEGSRVAVIEGEVHVQQGATEKKLRPGEQVATDPQMAPLPVSEEIAWSRQAETHLALLQQSLAQNAPEERVAFEVTSVRSRAPATGNGQRGAGGGGAPPPIQGCSGRPQFDPGHFSFPNATVYSLIAWAYGADICQLVSASGKIIGGPSWIKSDVFDIEATIPNGAANFTSNRSGVSSPPKLQKMLQSLLADRFRLAVHRENREVPVYALNIAKGGPKLQPSTDQSCGAPDDVITQQRSACGASVIALRAADQAIMRTFKMSLDNFSKILIYGLDRPVINKTQIEGGFDITFEFAPDRGLLQTVPVGGAMALTGPVFSRGGVPAASGASIFNAIQEQLGLKLEPTTGPVEFLVIDRVERPTEN